MYTCRRQLNKPASIIKAKMLNAWAAGTTYQPALPNVKGKEINEAGCWSQPKRIQKDVIPKM